MPHEFDLDTMAHRITDCHEVFADMADSVGDELMVNIQQEIVDALIACNQTTGRVRALLRVYSQLKRRKKLQQDFRQMREECRKFQFPSQGATTFLTEQPLFAGPEIQADTWEEAEKIAQLLDVKVIGIKDEEMAHKPGMGVPVTSEDMLSFPPRRGKDTNVVKEDTIRFQDQYRFTPHQRSSDEHAE